MKSPIQRKTESENKLKEFGVHINLNLPVIESQDEVKLRTAEEVAQRALVLCGVALYGEGLEHDETIEFLLKRRVWDSLTEKELQFVLNAEPPHQDRVTFLWRYESLSVMLWALGYIDKLLYPSDICDVPGVVTIINKKPYDQFVKKAVLRPTSEILDEADLIYRYRWAIVDARIKGESAPANLDSGVVYERHYAFNWLISYFDQDWDNVTTDT